MSQKRTYSYSTGELTELILEDAYVHENPWKDQLAGVNGEAITYDETGNPLTYRDGMTFEWAGKTLVGVNGNSEIDMNVIGMMCDGKTYYFEKNVQSDVVRILDEEGNILCEYVYDAWGNVELVKGCFI